MNRSRIVRGVVVLAGSALIGCASRTSQYRVSVVNRGSRPVTMWLLKENSPPQKDWVSPEQVAFSEPASDDHLPDVVVAPGKTATTHTMQATFSDPRGRAVLRIYNGKPTLTEMLATNRGEVGRFDLVLEPGTNAFVVSDEDGGLNVTRQSPSDAQR